MHRYLFRGDYELLLFKELVLTPAVFVLALAPGVGFALWMARRVRSDWASMALFSWTGTVAVVSVAAALAHVLRLGLWFVLAAAVAAVLGSIAYGARTFVRARGWPRFEGSPAAFAVPALAALLAGWERPWFGATVDTFYHLAAARSLLVTGRPLVTDPFHGTATRVLDPTSGVLHTFLALLSRTLSVDPATLYFGLTVLGAALVTLAFWTLAKTLARSDLAATVATAVWVFGAWYADFRMFAQPNRISLSLAFFAAALLVRLMREPKPALTAAFVLAAFGAATTHLAAAQLVLLLGLALLAFAGVYAFLEPRRERGVVRRVAVALGLSALAAAPVVGARVLALKGSSVIGEESYRYIGDQILHLPLGIRLVTPGGFGFGGPWLFWLTLAVAAFALAELRRRPDVVTLAVLAVLVLPAGLLFDPVVTTVALRASSYMTYRMADLLRAVPYLGVAWALAAFRPPRVPARAVLGGVAALTALAVALPYLAFTFFPGRGRVRFGHAYPVAVSQEWDYRAYWGTRNLAKLGRRFAGRYPLVAGQREVTFYLMGLQDIAVLGALPTHSPAYIDVRSGERRRRDNDRLIAPETPLAERRAIVERWGVDYVALGDTPEQREALESLLAQPTLFRLAFDSPRLHVLETLSGRPSSATSR